MKRVDEWIPNLKSNSSSNPIHVARTSGAFTFRSRGSGSLTCDYPNLFALTKWKGMRYLQLVYARDSRRCSRVTRSDEKCFPLCSFSALSFSFTLLSPFPPRFTLSPASLTLFCIWNLFDRVASRIRHLRRRRKEINWIAPGHFSDLCISRAWLTRRLNASRTE